MNRKSVKFKGVCLIVFLSVLFQNIFIGSFFNNNVYAMNNSERNKMWIEDIDHLKNELPKKHINLFANMKKEQFYKEVEDLKNSIPNMNDDEIKISLYKIVAKVGDSHTSVYEKTKTFYPIMTQYFNEELYITDTILKYEKILYCKIVKINNEDIKSVCTDISSVIPHENSAQIKKKTPTIIMNPDIMNGLHITSNKEKLELTLEKKDGEQFNIIIEAMDRKEKIELVQKGDSKELPLYLRNPRENYWFEYLKESNTMYVQYNSCRDMKNKPYEEFADEVIKITDDNKADKLIIDLRNNGGGSEKIIRPLINKIKENKNINKKYKLFVIVGRNTFSAAICSSAELKETNAIFVGEPTSGKLDHFGEVQDFILPNSKISVQYSTKYIELSKFFKNVPKGVDSLVPDIIVENSIEDYINNRDFVLDIVLRIK
ncbi:S41 family peptidase [Clostridium tagluense]|uniref:S41 family peptidase n=1 Tax=Clostridium tagluense TaxID=360422 RepID=UPI001C6E9285|nr:S41 family peptidase [Clostridium tagluense]MBW9159417.1 peptidase S41 [Clostridium tagluense]WLC66660.1 peptidase S41 [Clostridium tagluense]